MQNPEEKVASDEALIAALNEAAPEPKKAKKRKKKEEPTEKVVARTTHTDAEGHVTVREIKVPLPPAKPKDETEPKLHSKEYVTKVPETGDEITVTKEFGPFTTNRRARRATTRAIMKVVVRQHKKAMIARKRAAQAKATAADVGAPVLQPEAV